MKSCTHQHYGLIAFLEYGNIATVGSSCYEYRSEGGDVASAWKEPYLGSGFSLKSLAGLHHILKSSP